MQGNFELTLSRLYAYSKAGLTHRGIAAKKWLRSRPEKVIAVVSHSGFLRVGVCHRKTENADFRIFDFAEGEEEIGGKLIEWELTEAKGGGLGMSPKGVFMMDAEDFPDENADVAPGEVVNENPQ